jgi:methylglutaconyl-CoA hydratase
MRQYANLDVSLDPRGVLTVRLNRPDADNAIDAQTVSEFLSLLDTARLSADVRILLLRGNGPNFSGGMDPLWLRQMAAATQATNLRDAKSLATVFDELDGFPRPVIAAVHGEVVGEAIGLVATCDVVVASAETIFRAPELSFGLVPACVAPFLLAKVGQSHARNMLLTGRQVNAVHAQEIRLVHDIVPKPEDLDNAVEALLADTLQCAPQALKATKQLIRRLTFHGHSILTSDTLEDVAVCFAESRSSREMQEGLAANREERLPPWAQPNRTPA